MLRTAAFTVCAHVGLWSGWRWGKEEGEEETERWREVERKGQKNPEGGQLQDEFKSRPLCLITLLLSLALNLGAFCLFKRLRRQLVLLV